MKACRPCASPLASLVLLACCVGIVIACSMLFTPMEQESLYEPGQDKLPLTFHVFRDLVKHESLDAFKARVQKQVRYLERTYEVYRVEYVKVYPAAMKPCIGKARIYYRKRGK